MKSEEIKGSTKYLMFGAAIGLDILKWVLIAFPIIGAVGNEYIGIFGNLMFLLWFWSNGASPLKKSRLFNFFGNFVGEEATFGVWPGFTVMVWKNISKHNSEVMVKQTQNNNDVAGSISPDDDTNINDNRKAA